MAALARLIFPVAGEIKKLKRAAAARGGLSQIEPMMESYKAKTGVYPPADPGKAALNPLFYELSGTKLDNVGNYKTLDGSAQINTAQVPTTFGPAIGGFINSSKGGGDDDAATAQNFLKGLKSS